MYKICVFAGTTEGRQLVLELAERGCRVTACVATEYGESLIAEGENITVSSGRLDQSQMEAMFRSEGFCQIVDATHPYAAVVTENIVNACAAAGVPYLRLLRERGEYPENAVVVPDTAAAVEYLRSFPGNILLTTGSKELPAYSILPQFSEKVYARVLPVESSIAACRECGLSAAHILAMQGPFDTELNIAMLKSVKADILVTKEAGAKGGFPEKMEAAKALQLPVLIIGRPAQVEGLDYDGVLRTLSEQFGLASKKHVSIVGIGPGDAMDRTLRAQNAIGGADCLIGAARMLQAVAQPGQKQVNAIAPADILRAIREDNTSCRFAVVMSGDVGFFSGTKKLLPMLDKEQVELIPGLSSMVTLCSRLGKSYEDVIPVSLHGRDGDIMQLLRRGSRLFVLVGGENGMGKLCRELAAAGCGDVLISAGERLGYPEENITVGTANELMNHSFDSLCAALIEHHMPVIVTHGLPDEYFQRGDHADGSKVPMTKQEIRSIALSKLQLTRDAVCWDVGAGTGSVAIEMALQASDGHVYAIEKKEDALNLLRHNCEKLHVGNLTPVAGLAPQACVGLPAPTHVFVGGSSGNMEEILELCRSKNPGVRIVCTAIALETVAELSNLLHSFGGEVISVSVAQGRKAGPYHLMTGQNPVYIVTFPGRDRNEV